MSQTDGPYDAIVIGAGMSGLAAGIRLAMYDRRVVVLERHYLWGGLNSFYKRRGRLYDVGLHALTNYAPKGRRGVPLTKLLRQLRLRHADLKLGEQSFSEIAFPGERLRFSNEFELFESEVARAFPGQADGFRALVAEVMAYDSFSPPDPAARARPVLERHLSEPLLIEMLMLPMCYYGSAIPGDIAWYQFAILFKSFYDEGFARPGGGIRPLLDVLVKRFKELGGELRMKTGVSEVLMDGERAIGVRTDDGEELRADQVYSSAGYGPTMELAGRGEVIEPDDRGQLSFNETVVVTDRPPLEYPGQADSPGAGAAIVFFNDADTFDYRAPADSGQGPVDLRSGVICSPNHYAAEEPLTEGIMRFTALSDPAHWDAFADEERYAAAKHAASEALLDVAARYAPDPRPFEVDRDAFTPRTITRFCGHPLGAVYGAPNKRLDGRTPVEDLFLIGTDQGLLGVVGAMLSGISMANRHGLMSQASN